jgi:excisionase family DNA binding protein
MNPNPHPSGDDRALRDDRDELLTLTEAAAYLRTPVATLYWWRHNHIGPPSFKIGRRVCYRLSELREWVDRQSGEASTV